MNQAVKTMLAVVAMVAMQSQPLISAEAEDRFAYVNARPQFNITEKFFALYIGIWRGFDNAEIATIEHGASLLAKRNISWLVKHCETPSLQHQDIETIWTLDELRLDNEGQVIPIMEANRPGYRYFSMINLHGLYLRGTGDFKRPARLPGESGSDHRARIEAARAAWWVSASPKQTEGHVTVTLDTRIVNKVDAADVDAQFLKFSDYQQLGTSDPLLAALFYKTAPNRWPVSYDERAHKPHTFSEPKVWTASSPLSRDLLKARLEWNWCGSSLIARIVVPRGQLLQEGPNRSGRADHGPVTIEVVEGDL